MRQNPKLQGIQMTMQAGVLAPYQFLGDDTRNIADIIHADNLTVTQLETTHATIVARMKYFAQSGKKSIGHEVVVDECYRVVAEEHKGSVPCPFADNYQARKSVIHVTNLVLQRSVYYTDLNIHMIEEHQFYEGIGAPYRVDPRDVVEILNVRNNK